MQLESSITLFDDGKVENRFAELQITADGITSQVSRKVGNDEVISRINQSAEAIKIQADKVNIEGATIFSSGRLSQSSLNAAYDSNGAATTSVNNLKSDLASSSGTTVINGGHISTGTIDAARLNITGVINAINSNGTTTIDGGKITANSIGANKIKVSELLTLGSSSGAHINITSNGLNVYGSGAVPVASFGSTATIGRTQAYYTRLELSANALKYVWRSPDGTDETEFQVDTDGVVTTNGYYKGLFTIAPTTIEFDGFAANSYVPAQAYGFDVYVDDPSHPVGIVGYSSSNMRVRPTSFFVRDNTSIFAGFANDTSTAVTGTVTVKFYTLFLRATT